MEVKRSITINLRETELKEIVAAHLNKEGYEVEPQNVTFRVSSEIEGYGPMEHEVTKFNGCIVTCKK